MIPSLVLLERLNTFVAQSSTRCIWTSLIETSFRDRTVVHTIHAMRLLFHRTIGEDGCLLPLLLCSEYLRLIMQLLLYPPTQRPTQQQRCPALFPLFSPRHPPHLSQRRSSRYHFHFPSQPPHSHPHSHSPPLSYSHRPAQTHPLLARPARYSCSYSHLEL